MGEGGRAELEVAMWTSRVRAMRGMGARYGRRRALTTHERMWGLAFGADQGVWMGHHVGMWAVTRDVAPPRGVFSSFLGRGVKMRWSCAHDVGATGLRGARDAKPPLKHCLRLSTWWERLWPAGLTWK